MSSELLPAQQQSDYSETADGHALMRIIDRAASSPDFDVAKLQQLLDVKERWDAAEARKAFVHAMTAFKSDPPSILKSKPVNIPGGAQFAHATLAHVVDAVCESLSKYGLSHRWETKQEGGLITVTCIITHELGHSECTTMTAPPDDSGRKNGIQQIASTQTYLQRYTLLAATGLAAKDMDTDGGGPAQESLEPITEEQRDQIIAELDAADAAIPGAKQRYFEWMVQSGFESVGEIYTSQFQKFLKAAKEQRQAAEQRRKQKA